MATLRFSGGFSVTGAFTGLAVLAGAAFFCVPWAERRIEARAREARAAAERIETTLGGEFGRFESLARTYGKTVLEAPPVSAVPEFPPPLPASPVEPIPDRFSHLRRPPPLGIPEWRPGRRRVPPFVRWVGPANRL